ncbi:UNVERIFIED_CONTAM: hypothetical protein FKN15_041175 [Acipenser sinensis]
MNTRCPPKRVPSAARFFTLCRLTVQPPQSYSVGGQRSSGQLTGKPAGARPDYRGRWCAVPGDLSQTSDDRSLSDFETAHRALINVWIPSVFMRGRASNAYHVYQVYIRILDNEWNVYRRYTDFRTLHHRLRSRFPQVDTFNFPPKKAIGNKDAKFVEGRRKQLQSYLRSVMNKVIQTLPEFTASPTKENLLQLLPFCM